MPNLDDIRRARMFLLGVGAADPAATREFVAECGPIEAARRVRARMARAGHRGLPESEAAANVRDDIQAIESGFARLLIPEDDEWPHDLLGGLSARACDEPIALWVRGSASLRDLTSDALTVTGARSATSYGKYVATDIGAALASRGRPLLTGGALGVDTAVLRGAVAGDGPAVAVLPCGLHRAYPPRNEDLLASVTDAGGLLISEYPPSDHSPRRTKFRDRCRLLAALTPVTVIVEASRHSTPMLVARRANTLGRTVLAVPGPITSTYSDGVHELLRGGHATAITGVDDILNHP